MNFDELMGLIGDQVSDICLANKHEIVIRFKSGKQLFIEKMGDEMWAEIHSLSDGHTNHRSHECSMSGQPD